MTWTIVIGTVLALATILGGALYHQWRLNERLRTQLDAAAIDLENLQQACSRLAPAGVVQRLVTDGGEPETGPAAEHKVVTAMFVDLVGYTAMSERLEPTVLVRMLNGYYERMSDAIHEHRGRSEASSVTGLLPISAHSSRTRGSATTQCAPPSQCGPLSASTMPSSRARGCRR